MLQTDNGTIGDKHISGVLSGKSIPKSIPNLYDSIIQPPISKQYNLVKNVFTELFKCRQQAMYHINVDISG
jgi:hypothetical protein